jgi:hypothetical protein
MNLHYRMLTKFVLFCVFIVNLQGCDNKTTDTISITTAQDVMVQGTEAMAIEQPGCYPLRFVVQTFGSNSMIALEKGRMPTALKNETDCRDTKVPSLKPIYTGEPHLLVVNINNESFSIDTQRWFPTKGCYLVSAQMLLRGNLEGIREELRSRTPEDLSVSTQPMTEKDSGQPIPISKCYDQKL